MYVAVISTSSLFFSEAFSQNNLNNSWGFIHSLISAATLPKAFKNLLSQQSSFHNEAPSYEKDRIQEDLHVNHFLP